jgi:arginase
MSRHRTLISVSSGWGASNMGTGAGALFLCHSTNPLAPTNKRFDESFFQKSYQIQAHPAGILSPRLSFSYPHGKTRFENVLDTIQQTYDYVSRTLKNNSFPFVLGGDHSIAVGTWSAVKNHINQDFGLIWLDAHLDAHTPQTSPSQARHGMPLAALMGYGDSELVTLGSDLPKLKPENLVIIGARSFEDGEHELLKRLNVRIMYSDEINEQGFDGCFKEAMEIVTSNNKPFGISFDIDGFDASLVPGTGTPEPNGFDEESVLESMVNILNHDKLIAFELVEYNPALDQDNKTLKLIWKLVSTLEGAEQWITSSPQKSHSL